VAPAAWPLASRKRLTSSQKRSSPTDDQLIRQKSAWWRRGMNDCWPAGRRTAGWLATCRRLSTCMPAANFFRSRRGLRREKLDGARLCASIRESFRHMRRNHQTTRGDASSPTLEKLGSPQVHLVPFNYFCDCIFFRWARRITSEALKTFH